MAVFITGSLTIIAAVREWRPRLSRSISAIEQLARYPANESWIAIGSDTFANREEQEILCQQCGKNGVGLIEVDGRGRMKTLLVPRPRHVFNDYLSRYGKRDQIRSIIDKSPGYGPTPPERRQNRRRIFNIFLMSALTALLIAVVYQGRQSTKAPDLIEEPFGPTDEVSETNLCPAVSLNERAYVVVESTPLADAVDRRLTELRAAGIRGHKVMAARCLDLPDATTVAIYTGKVYPSRPAAEQAARGYEKVASQLGISVREVTVMRVLANDGPDR